MARHLHIYTSGKDPFTFLVKNVIVHVHQGAPPASGSSSGGGGGGTQAGPALDPLPYSDLPPVLGVRVMSPHTRRLLEEIDGDWNNDDWAEKILAQKPMQGGRRSLSQLDSVLDGVATDDDDGVAVVVFDLKAERD